MVLCEKLLSQFNLLNNLLYGTLRISLKPFFLALVTINESIFNGKTLLAFLIAFTSFTLVKKWGILLTITMFKNIINQLSESDKNYLFQQIEILENKSQISLVKDCLWRIATNVKLFPDLEFTGKLSPQQIRTTWGFIYYFMESVETNDIQQNFQKDPIQILRDLQVEYNNAKELLESQYNAILKSKEEQIEAQQTEIEYLRKKVSELTLLTGNNC